MISSIATDLARRDPAVWWEMHATIYDKMRQPVTDPNLIANKMQREDAEILRICQRDGIPCWIIQLKGRQQGSSTFGTAVGYHKCQSSTCRGLIIGDEYEKSVANLVSMFEEYARTDRMDWGNTFHAPSGKFSHGSELTTETANDPRAGASGTFQWVLATEVAWWKETGKISARKTMQALFNCVPRVAGTFIMFESTPNGMGGIYYETFQNAISLKDYLAGNIPKTWNGFFKVCYFWHEHPEYTLYADAATAAEIMNTLSDRESEMLQERPDTIDVHRLNWRRSTLKSPAFNGNEEAFEQEYPFNETSGFLTSGRSAFNQKRLQKMMAHTLEPKFGMLEWANDAHTRVIFRECPEDEAILKLWEPPVPGHRYLFPIDPAEGSTQTIGADPDSHAPLVMRAGTFAGGDWHPSAVVARLADCFLERREKAIVCRWDIDVLDEYAARLAIFYGSPPIIPEMNHDRGLTEKLFNRGLEVYRRTVRNRVEQTETKLLGWKTDAQTRPSLIEGAVTAIRKYDEPGEGLLIWDPLIISQFSTCITNADGKVEAMSGCHDDTVMACAIGLACLSLAKAFPFPQRDRYRDHDVSDSGYGDSTFN